MTESNSYSAAWVLLADDQPDVLKALRLLLKPEGYQVKTASSPVGVLETIRNHDFDVVLMDLNYVRGHTSGEEGLDLLSRIQQIDTTLPVVVMTAWSSIELAVEAMRHGARDFVSKPWKNERLMAVLHTQIELSRALRGHGPFSVPVFCEDLAGIERDVPLVGFGVLGRRIGGGNNTPFRSCPESDH